MTRGDASLALQPMSQAEGRAWHARAGTRASSPAWNPHHAAFVLALLLVVFANVSFWQGLWRALGPSELSHAPLLLSVAVALTALFWMILCLSAWRALTKPAWIALAILAASAAYFMDSYGLVVDRVAIQSVVETDPREAAEWFSWRMLPYLLSAGVAALWVSRLRLEFGSWRRDLGAKLGVIAITVALIATLVFLDFARLSSIARNHRELQHQINPTTVLQSTYGYVRRLVAPRPTRVAAVHTDAHLGPTWQPGARPRVLVLVIGESARASSFSVLGYARETNPRLAAEATFNFGQVASCGTSTAVSLPCMFTDLGQANYSDFKARGRESLLDVIGRAGLHSLWVDNNTGSKNVASRTGQESVADAADPEFCNAIGCFDDILVKRLRELLSASQLPTVIVLHQKGSHGPSYFERYPVAFRRFTPTCDSNQLDDCTRLEIVNTYDNSILYTDHNLVEVIAALREREADLDSAMLYLSDHGESTGENGMFLHGAPLFMAPEEQTRVPLILWFSEGWSRRFGVDRDCVAALTDNNYSHDDLFHSVLGLIDVQMRGYRPERDILFSCRTRGQDLAQARG
ncbi:MAG: phosphoethanolamine--lipid A transferase [Chiayiivirga sp.]|jgi:lipid A ethanolaminephosphotransferase|uniref:phosphoethanolamine transferase n=1 Tax=Chiayiivirga sp. TaxID=2041042 RepID=UPI0025BB0ACB|nr:phosphoethanolamine--lipid A transferase [Chiayiivirga sp.]MCI1709466.1 phosphoethanolamine--lipid A transferase [Chiayiivirga sp.]MCI1730246.1 phosphoethanolamine--lipid A transferase [Chiayiivirga sp.]